MRVTAGLLMLLVTLDCSAQPQQPLWELHLGAAALRLPFYRGAQTGEDLLLPVPLFIYRGEKVRADEDGVRGLLFDSPAAKLDLSMAAGIPVPSKHNEAREGMPDLDPTVELGPNLQLRLWRSATSRQSLWFNMPLRGVFSADGLKLSSRGATFSPYLNWSIRYQRWDIDAAVGPVFASGKYHDYYYEVEPAYATPSRPVYHPEGGYSGSRLTLAVRYKTDRWWLALFSRIDNLNDTRFEDSPLVAKKHYFAAGVVLTWRIAEAQAPAKVIGN
jgi:outer membrane scaffolding protein for murein synthesis (MipA/OmpV family)